MIRKVSISAALALGLIIAAIVERSLIGRHYVTLSFACAFALYWSIEFLISYVIFRKSYEKRYNYYKAQVVNSTNLSLEYIEKHPKIYYKKFKRTMIKESFLKISYILISLSIAIAFLVTMVI